MYTISIVTFTDHSYITRSVVVGHGWGGHNFTF